LKLQFEDDLVTSLKEEANGANAYALEKGARDGVLKAAQKSKSQKTGMLAETSSALAEGKGNLKDEKADKKS